VSYFTLRTIIVLMETIKDFYSSTTIPPTAAVATRRVPAKPRTAIVINIFVSVGMFVRNSVISFSPLAVAQREEEHRNCEQVPKRPTRSARFGL
jgi:hypothetical protein